MFHSLDPGSSRSNFCRVIRCLPISGVEVFWQNLQAQQTAEAFEGELCSEVTPVALLSIVIMSHDPTITGMSCAHIQPFPLELFARLVPAREVVPMEVVVVVQSISAEMGAQQLIEQE